MSRPIWSGQAARVFLTDIREPGKAGQYLHAVAVKDVASVLVSQPGRQNRPDAVVVGKPGLVDAKQDAF